jgi:SpoIIAA-like
MNVTAALGGQIMLKFELLRDRGVLIVTPNGPLEKADFERLAKEVDPFIASKGKLTGLLIYTESFPGWDSFGALVSHLKFVADHHRQIVRIAAVTDSGFRKIIPTIATHFIEAQIKVFDFTQKAAALAWLETGE